MYKLYCNITLSSSQKYFFLFQIGLYTNQKVMPTQKPFNQIICLGSTNQYIIIYNTNVFNISYVHKIIKHNT